MFGSEDKKRSRRDLLSANTIRTDILADSSRQPRFSIEERKISELPTVRQELEGLITYDREGRAQIDQQALSTLLEKTAAGSTVEDLEPRSWTMPALIVGGLLIGLVASFFWLQHQRGAVPALLEMAALNNDTIQVLVGEDADGPVAATEIADFEREVELDAARASLGTVPEEALDASEIVGHAQGRSIDVGPGVPVFVAGSQRSYGPSFVETKVPVESGARVETPRGQPELEPVGQAGRYRAAHSDVQWQGGWSVDSPQRNVALGSTYTEYLDRRVGSGLSERLSSFESGPTRVLGSLGTKTQPVKVQPYSN